MEKIPYNQPIPFKDWYLNQINQILDYHSLPKLDDFKIWFGQEADELPIDYAFPAEIQVKTLNGKFYTWLNVDSVDELPPDFVEPDLNLFMLIFREYIPNKVLDELIIRCSQHKWVDAHMDWHDAAPLVKDLITGELHPEPGNLQGLYPLGAPLHPEDSCQHYSDWGFIGDRPCPNVPVNGYYLIWRNCYCS
jgi:hypothetical protein